MICICTNSNIQACKYHLQEKFNKRKGKLQRVYHFTGYLYIFLYIYIFLSGERQLAVSGNALDHRPCFHRKIKWGESPNQERVGMTIIPNTSHRFLVSIMMTFLLNAWPIYFSAELCIASFPCLRAVYTVARPICHVCARHKRKTPALRVLSRIWKLGAQNWQS